MLGREGERERGSRGGVRRGIGRRGGEGKGCAVLSAPLEIHTYEIRTFRWRDHGPSLRRGTQEKCDFLVLFLIDMF